MVGLFKTTDRICFKYILKIILKDIKCRIKHEKILNVYHSEAVDLYNLTSNLREVC